MMMLTMKVVYELKRKMVGKRIQIIMMVKAKQRVDIHLYWCTNDSDGIVVSEVVAEVVEETMMKAT